MVTHLYGILGVILDRTFGNIIRMLRVIRLPKEERGHLSWTFVGTLAVILAYGLIMMFSASYSSGYTNHGGNIYYFIKPQAIVAAVGFVVMLGVSLINYRALRYMFWTFYVITLALLVLALFMALPIYLAVVMSLKPVQELFVFPPKLYVIDPTLSNYSAMFRLCSDLWVPFSRYVFNSVFVTVSVTVCQVVFSAMAAFCLAKVRFPGAKAINAIIVVALLYQSNVIYIMQYMVMAKMGMIDTYWALILPSVAAPMNLFLMRQSMTQVPDAMIEAAKVDGADMFRICWQVVMPNQKPALMTVIIFSFQAAWNIQGGTLVFSESLKTLPTVVQQAASAGLARAGVAMAAAVFMLVPPIVIFMLAQRQVIETMAHSGIKD